MDIKKRFFENKKSEEKWKAVEAWKRGEGISSIASNLGRSRITIRRWLRDSDQKLARNSSRSRLKVDQLTKSRVLELYVLMKRPSIPRLKEALGFHFHIHFSEPQLRRLIKRWNFDCFRPSPLYDSLRKQTDTSDVSKILSGASSEKGSSREWLERFERQVHEDLPTEAGGADGESPAP